MDLKEFFRPAKNTWIIFLIFAVLAIIDFYFSLGVEVFSESGNYFIGGQLNHEIANILFFPVIFLFDLFGIQFFDKWYLIIMFTIGFAYLWVISCLISFLWNKFKQR